MKLKETSTIKSLFMMPAIELHANKLIDAFKKNLTTEISSEDAPESSSQEEEPMDIELDHEHDRMMHEAMPEEACEFLFKQHTSVSLFVLIYLRQETPNKP